MKRFSMLIPRRPLRYSISSWSRNDNGFTLIELLVVSGIFIVISTIVIAILFIALRASKKSESIILVKQNGEQAMTQMVRKMRFAKSLDEPASCDNKPEDHIKITSVDLSQSTFTCPANFNSPNFIDLDGIRLTNSDTVVVQSCSFVCTRQAAGPPMIGIFFTLSKVNLNGLPEESTVIPFQSSVTLRNLEGQ